MHFHALTDRVDESGLYSCSHSSPYPPLYSDDPNPRWLLLRSTVSPISHSHLHPDPALLHPSLPTPQCPAQTPPSRLAQSQYCISWAYVLALYPYQRETFPVGIDVGSVRLQKKRWRICDCRNGGDQLGMDMKRIEQGLIRVLCLSGSMSSMVESGRMRRAMEQDGSL